MNEEDNQHTDVMMDQNQGDEHTDNAHPNDEYDPTYEQRPDELQSDSSSSSSSESKCPSWMLEDLEGPQDNVIFANRPPYHAGKRFKILKAFQKVKQKKKKEKG